MFGTGVLYNTCPLTECVPVRDTSFLITGNGPGSITGARFACNSTIVVSELVAGFASWASTGFASNKATGKQPVIIYRINFFILLCLQCKSQEPNNKNQKNKYKCQIPNVKIQVPNFH